jgi:hypothetical protein
VTLRAPATDPRLQLYPDAPRDGPRTIVFEGDVDGGARLVPGERVTTWDGRDGTPAKRLLCGGAYELSLLVPGRTRPASAALNVSDPRVVFIGPRWPEGAERLGGPGGMDPTLDLAAVRRAVATTHEVDAGRTVGAVPVEEVEQGLRRAALAIVSTHGSTSGFSTYASDAPVYDGDASTRISEDHAMFAAPTSRPLRDAHLVIIHACKTGSDRLLSMSAAHRARHPCVTHADEECRCDARPADEAHDSTRPASAIVSRIIDNGADVVISFTRPVAVSSGAPYLEAMLGERGRRVSIREAARGAAQHADDATWWPLTCELRWRSRLERSVAPLDECIRVDTAAGIDQDEERLYPARWGNSTN